MKDYEEYTDYEARKLEEGAKAVDEKIIKSVEAGIKRKLSAKEKNRVLEDYSFWYDKNTSKKDAEFLKKEISDLNSNTKSKYFNY